VHAGGTGELHAGGPPGCLPRKLNIGTAPYPRRVTAPTVRRRSGRHSGTLAHPSDPASVARVAAQRMAWRPARPPHEVARRGRPRRDDRRGRRRRELHSGTLTIATGPPRSQGQLMMEPLWSPVVATGGNQRQITRVRIGAARPPARLRQDLTPSLRVDRVPVLHAGRSSARVPLAEPPTRPARVYAAQRKPVASGRGASGLAGRPPGGSSSL
jgi:hypothetical protein